QLETTWGRYPLAAQAGEGEELLTGAGVVAQQAVDGGGDRARALGPDAAVRHAEVLGLDDDADALRLEILVQPVRDLLGQALLDLQVPAEELDDAGQLGQAEDALAGHVAHVRGA